MKIIETFSSRDMLVPKAALALQNWEGLPVYHKEYGVRHPLSAYNFSITTVAQRANTVLDILDDTVLIHSLSSPDDDWRNKLLEAMDHLLDILNEHVEDCGGVLRSFFPKSSGRAFEDAHKKFRKKTKTYRDHICKLDNFIKHNQGRLRFIKLYNGHGILPGYYVEGPIASGGLGPSPIIHGTTHTAFSFNRDIPFHICNVFGLSAALAEILHTVHGQLVPNIVSGKQNISNADWNKMVARVAALPHLYYPDEVKKPVPSIKFGEANIKIEYPAALRKAKTLPGTFSVTATCVVDHVEHINSLPYMTTDPVQRKLANLPL